MCFNLRSEQLGSVLETTVSFPLGGRGEREEAKLVLLCDPRTTPGTTQERRVGFLAALLLVPFPNDLVASHLGRGFQVVAVRSWPLPPSLCGLLPKDLRSLLPEFPSPTPTQTSRDLSGDLRSLWAHPEGRSCPTWTFRIWV